jgi:RNA polymerase sigma-70 factor (ECF subfamily)
MPTTTSSKEDLQPVLAAALGGDRRAIGVLYEVYQPEIQRYLARRLEDKEAASDLTSQVFERMIRAIDQQHAWRDSFTAWLYRIAHNLLVDFVRAQTRQPDTELHPGIPCPRSGMMEEEAARRCLADQVRVAASRIRPAYATVLSLRFDEELSHAAAGARLGKTSRTVKVTQFRALRAVRRELERSAAA